MTFIQNSKSMSVVCKEYCTSLESASIGTFEESYSLESHTDTKQPNYKGQFLINHVSLNNILLLKKVFFTNTISLVYVFFNSFLKKTFPRLEIKTRYPHLKIFKLFNNYRI